MGIDFSFRYMVQFGFSNLENAEKFLREIAEAGYEGCIIDADEGGEIMRMRPEET